MKLEKLLDKIEYTLVKGNLDVLVKDIAYDSRKVLDDYAFVAIIGNNVDGHDYVENALDSGAKVLIVSKDIGVVDSDITIVKVDDTSKILSRLSMNLFDNPHKKMTTIAITGTKGKTTISTMIKKILDDNNKDCGLIGTLGVFYKDKYFHTMNTSPESYDVFKYMREMLDNGVKYLVMEVSSQSLKLKRWSNVIFDYALFTNLSLDHVGKDEHDSFEEYKYCKSLLFKQCKTMIGNIDSEYFNEMSNGVDCEIVTYGKSKNADYIIDNVNNVMGDGFVGIELGINGKINENFKVSIPGLFTGYNATAAIMVCSLIGLDIDSIRSSLEDVSVKGRMESVKVSNKFSVLIDYAYQGIAMENVLSTIKEGNPKRIVSVFGCGGNRSRQRRFDCGEVSGKYADLSILTADNPRYENNDDIIKDILVGMNKVNGNYIIVPDRKEAIKKSIVEARDGDVILILGKGHEDYQEIEGVRYPFDERVVIREIIDSLSNDEKVRLGIIC